ncbi:MAG: metalloregulator ArsR/SmtB family transcription factor [Pseudomonadota bacterium]
MSNNETVLKALKATGEATRLRILVLLQHGDLAVGELVDILGQSQPRLSHHLKTLTQADVITRLPEGSWVFYRLTREAPVDALLTTLLNSLDTTLAPYSHDLAALKKVRRSRSATANSYFESVAEDWDTIRALHFPTDALETALLDSAGPGPFHKHVDLGTGTGRMINLFGDRAREAEGLDISHHMLTVARANLVASGHASASVRQGDVTATPFADHSADLVTVHQVLHFLDDPSAVIDEASRILRPGGKLLIADFAPHTLDFLRDQQGHRRLGIRETDMINWCKAAGLDLSAPRRFDPPSDLDQGLSVLIWSATQPALVKETAA